MKTIVTCKEMKELDRSTIEKQGIPSCVLMERAALSVADDLAGRLSAASRVLVVCGSGNNGGDGMALARILHLRGISVEIFFPGKKEKMTSEAARQWKIAAGYGVTLVNNPQWNEYTTIIDAIFGVGLARPVKGSYRELLQKMNQAQAYKVAVDIPSGLNGDTGQVMGIAFQADLTVTFSYRKRGMCFYPGRTICGEIQVADVGIYEQPDHCLRTRHLEQSDLAGLPHRRPDGNKGTFGKVLVVGGSPGMCGAAYMAAAAALKAGAGMVCIYTSEENRIPLQTLLPEAMISCRMSEEERERLWNWCDLMVIGPGVGMSAKSWERTEWFLTRSRHGEKKIILDADGLNLLAKNPSWKSYLGPHVILTPHLGEMSRLCERSISEMRGKLVEIAQMYADETGTVCILKDACTVVCSQEGYCYVNLSGNAGMATAGSGDVLSGILAGTFCIYSAGKKKGFLCNTTAYQAAVGVYLHGRSGDLAAERFGMHSMKAGDIISCIPDAIRKKEEKL